MPRQITIELAPQERAALLSMAIQDIRPPNEQLRYLVTQEAHRRGLLDPPGAIKCESDAPVISPAAAL